MMRFNSHIWEYIHYVYLNSSEDLSLIKARGNLTREKILSASGVGAVVVYSRLEGILLSINARIHL